MDGQSLKPLLGNPTGEWDRPVVMTYGLNNHAIQTERWRYIQYRDGGQELYDHNTDPNEWTNLAANPECRDVVRELQGALPKINREHIVARRKTKTKQKKEREK